VFIFQILNPMSSKITKVALSGITGTTFMTISSELMSLMGQNFSEPDHLRTMIGRLTPSLSKRATVIAGWGAHYAMGIVFAAVYVELWETHQIRHTVKNGIILGLLSGLIGLVIWKATFKTHPLPPLMKYNRFYLQRIPAHVVFAVFATLNYRLMKQQEEKSGLRHPEKNVRQTAGHPNY